MQVLSSDDLKTLTETHNGMCVSLFLPTYRGGQEGGANVTRFKNRLKEAEGKLQAAGRRPEQIAELLRPARDFLADGDWWHEPAEGLAVFVSGEVFRHYRLPYAFPELTVVGDRFHLKPLLPLLTSDGHFHILALSQNEVRLLKATRMSVTETELTDVPRSLAEVLQYQEVQDQERDRFLTRTVRAAAPGEARGRQAIFHGGHGGAAEDRQDDIREFFRLLDKGLRQVLREHQAPLVLAGVEFLLALYREINSYPHLVPEGIVGNPEELSAEELHRRAWALVEPIFTRAQREAAELYHQAAGQGLAASDLRQVVLAATEGRVGTLFVPLAGHQWGQFDRETGRVDLHEQEQPGDQDLVDFAAVMGLLHGARVYAVEEAELPDRPVAAALRY